VGYDATRYSLFLIYGNLVLRMIFFLFPKNDFAEVSKNLAGYRTKNNFVEIIKIIM